MAGWEWDNHLNGYVSNRPNHFTCECKRKIATPTGFHRCGCGKQWNSYVIGTGGRSHEAAADKYLVREIPVRKDVIVASKRGVNQLKDTAAQPNMDHESQEDFNEDYPHLGGGKAAAKRHRVDSIGDDGEEVIDPTFRRQPRDWARRDKGGRWQPKAIG